MKQFLKVILLLLLPLALITAYALYPDTLDYEGITLEKADLSPLDSLAVAAGLDPLSRPAAGAMADGVSADTLCDTAMPAEPASGPLVVQKPDSSQFRILFFGDSMLEGLAKRMCDYSMENGYALTSVIWYSSSTKLWAESDTLQYFMRLVEPDFVMLCLGSNELFVRDLDKRDKYIARIVEKLSPYPFVWISPPNWKDDTGINDLIIRHVGLDRYFDSRHLVLQRASDHAHPTHAAAALWMDTVAQWMSSPAARTPLPMNLPAEKRKRKFQQFLLSPVRN